MDLSRIAVALALVLATVPSAALAVPGAADAPTPILSAVDASPASFGASSPITSVGDAPSSLSADPSPAIAPGAGACFPGDGRRFDIGNRGPGIVAVVHLSALTDPFNPGAFGVELAGTALNQSIVTLQAGVRYDGVDAPGEFLADPFAPFAYVFDYRLRLPMFSSLGDGATEYESTRPFSGPVERAEC